MWNSGVAIKSLRNFEGLSQKSLSKISEYSPTYLSLVETGKESPSEDLLKDICRIFTVNYVWLTTGKGQPFEDKEKSKELLIQMRRPKTQKTLLAISAATAWILPLFSVSVTAGVAVEAVINKMQKLYKAKNATELAKALEIERSTITRWVQTNKIPDKYIKKVSEEKKIPVEYLSLDDSSIDDFIDLMVSFTEDQSNLFKNKDTDAKIIRKNFIKRFGLEGWDQKRFA